MSENDNITEWLEDLRKKETGQSAQASAIIEKHLVNAGLPFKKFGEPDTWFGVGWELYLNIDQYLAEEKHSEVLKTMLAELVDFCEISTSESFAYKLKLFFDKFIESDSKCRKITPLLPQKALDHFDEIRRMMSDEHERYLEMLNQQGY